MPLLKIGNMQIYTNAKTMNYELKRLELAIMNVFMYLLVLIIGKSKVLFVLRECAVFEFKSGNSAGKYILLSRSDASTIKTNHLSSGYIRTF